MSFVDWTDLADELDCWHRSGGMATFWWRDDDAVEPSAALDRLLEFAAVVPLCLAVIPAAATPELAARLAAFSNVSVLQHGWRHQNHCGPTAKNEYPATRLDGEVSCELAAGKAQLTMLFGTRALRVFVPPFHGFDDRFTPLLAARRIVAISRFGPSQTGNAWPGVREVNVHVSLFDWRSQSFGGEAAALSRIVEHLRARRLGGLRREEPTGVLTHHLVQDAPSYRFLERFVDATAAHPAARWVDAQTLFD